MKSLAVSLEEPEVAVGIDDGMFVKQRGEWTVLAGVKFVDLRLSDIAFSRITVDGTDGVVSAEKIVRKLVNRGERAAVFLDGVTYAGFNLVDPEELAKRTGVIAISIFRRKPNEERILRALKLHFQDWESRWEVISRASTNARKIWIRGRTIYYYSFPESPSVSEIIRKMAVASKIPEPLRMADMFAKEIGKFLMRSKFK